MLGLAFRLRLMWQVLGFVPFKIYGFALREAPLHFIILDVFNLKSIIMKKRNVHSLRLNKNQVSNLTAEKVIGGATYPCSTGPGLTSVAPQVCKINCETIVPAQCN